MCDVYAIDGLCDCVMCDCAMCDWMIKCYFVGISLFRHPVTPHYTHTPHTTHHNTSQSIPRTTFHTPHSTLHTPHIHTPYSTLRHTPHTTHKHTSHNSQASLFAAVTRQEIARENITLIQKKVHTKEEAWCVVCGVLCCVVRGMDCDVL